MNYTVSLGRKKHMILVSYCPEMGISTPIRKRHAVRSLTRMCFFTRLANHDVNHAHPWLSSLKLEEMDPHDQSKTDNRTLQRRIFRTAVPLLHLNVM